MPSYTVQSGDTLSKIASQYSVPISSISGYRSGDPNLIYPGENLTVGGNSSIAGSTQVPPNIPSSTLSGTSNTLPQAPPTDYSSYFTEALSLYNASQSTEATRLQQERTAKQNELSTASSQLEGKAGALTSTESSLGVPQDVEALKQLNLQIGTKIGQIQGISPETASQAGVPLEIATGRANELKRQQLAELYALQGKQAALQGNIDLSQKLASRQVDLQFAPIEQKIKNLQQFLEINKDNFTAEQTKNAEVLKIVLQRREQEIAQQKTTQSAVITYMHNFPDAGVLPTDDLITAQQKVAKSPSFQLKQSRTEGLIGGTDILNLLRGVQYQQQTGVTPGQIVGANTGLPVKLTDEQRVRYSGYQQFTDFLIPKATQLLKTVTTGGAIGRLLTKEQTLPLAQRTITPQQNDLLATMATMQNSLIYLLSGKQISQEEYNRLLSQMPSANLTNAQNTTRLKLFNDFINSKFQGELKTSGYKIATGEPLQGGTSGTTSSGLKYTIEP